MHGREGFTLAQYEAAVDLAMFLKEKEIGSVRVCMLSNFMGKHTCSAKTDQLVLFPQ